MTAEKIKYNKLPEAIRIAFTDDKNIFQFFDEKAKVNNVEEIVESIIRKLKTYGEELEIRGVYLRGELIGYFAFYKVNLVSFAINVSYRTRSNLREFYRLMKKEMDIKFECLLFSRNIRAIKYLLKNGMKIIYSNNLITKLSCL